MWAAPSILTLLLLGWVTCTTVAKKADRKFFCSTEVQEGQAVTRLAGSTVPAENRAQPTGLMKIITLSLAYPISQWWGLLGREVMKNRPKIQPPRLAILGIHISSHQVKVLHLCASYGLLPWHSGHFPTAMLDHQTFLSSASLLLTRMNVRCLNRYTRVNV